MPLRLLIHPLASHLLTGLRDYSTPPQEFRRLARTLTTLLIIEATRGMQTQLRAVRSPLEATEGFELGQGLAVVPVLRAGLGMLDPVVELFPDVAVGYIGLERHHDTAISRSYYKKLPKLEGRYTLCVDPMLATGGSASQAISFLKDNGGAPIVMVSVVSAPDGIARLEHDHPDVEIVTAVVDRGLDERKYIVPGLGDFGDRLYGTL